MNTTEFKQIVRSLTKTVGRGKAKRVMLCSKKAQALDNTTKNKLIRHIVANNRGGIISEFLNPETDRTWLASMGYMYSYQNKDFKFLCTSEDPNYHPEHSCPL